MVQNFRTYVLAGMSVLMFMPSGLFAQMTFKKVELRTNYGRAEEGKKGKLIVDGNSIRFVHDKNERDEYFSIPSKTVTDLFYSRVSGRRIKTAIFLTGPLGLFLKGKKH